MKEFEYLRFSPQSRLSHHFLVFDNILNIYQDLFYLYREKFTSLLNPLSLAPFSPL